MKFMFGIVAGLLMLYGAKTLWQEYGQNPLVAAGVETAAKIVDTAVPLVAPSGDTKAVSAPTQVGVPTTLPGTSAPVEKDWLTAGQRQALSMIGVDASTLPKELTPTMEACFVGAIGATRVAEIKAGATPTLLEMGKAAKCL